MSDHHDAAAGTRERDTWARRRSAEVTMSDRLKAAHLAQKGDFPVDPQEIADARTAQERLESLLSWRERR